MRSLGPQTKQEQNLSPAQRVDHKYEHLKGEHQHALPAPAPAPAPAAVPLNLPAVLVPPGMYGNTVSPTGTSPTHHSHTSLPAFFLQGFFSNPQSNLNILPLCFNNTPQYLYFRTHFIHGSVINGLSLTLDKEFLQGKNCVFVPCSTLSTYRSTWDTIRTEEKLLK